MTERAAPELGHGMNITIERRSVDGQPDSYAGLVQELVGLHVGLMVTSSTWAPQMIKQASDTMPIVMAGGDADGLRSWCSRRRRSLLHGDRNDLESELSWPVYRQLVAGSQNASKSNRLRS